MNLRLPPWGRRIPAFQPLGVVVVSSMATCAVALVLVLTEEGRLPKVKLTISSSLPESSVVERVKVLEVSPEGKLSGVPETL